MPSAVSDPEQEERGGNLPVEDTPDFLRQREETPNTPAELLDRIPTMSDEEGATLDKKRGLDPKAVDDAEKSGGHPNLVGRGHTGDGGDDSSAAARLIHNRKFIIGAGSGLFALIVAGGIFLSFLNVFKLDGLMSNIEQRAFLRHNASLNTRSSKWITAYITARMLDFNDSSNTSENRLFRSERVDTNSIFTDWYRTMRTSKFEDDLYRSKGIKFTSIIGPDGKIRPGRIDINGEKPIDVPLGTLTDADIAGIENGNIATLDKFQEFLDVEKFDNDKQARQAIKRVVNENTHFYQVYKRRMIRKSIQNMTGVRSWRFFENTRNKITEKKIEVRNKMLDKILPDPNSSIVGRVTRCIFGINRCNPSRDTVDPKNLASDTAILGTEDNDNRTDTERQNETALASSLDEAGFSDALKKVLAQANILARVLNIPQTLDMLSAVDKGMRNLVKYVVLARGAQAAGLFQVLETSRDQLKSGQVNPEEVNGLMQNLNSAASSDGWVKVVEGKGDPSTASTTGACSQESQAAAEKDPTAHQNDYAPLCADQRIGNATRGDQLQTDYTNTIGQIVHPIVDIWSTLKASPLGFIFDIIQWFADLINGVVEAIVHSILSILGLNDDVKTAIQWIFAKLSNFLGLTIMKGYEGAGTTFNWALQGGAYTAEASGRREGAAKTTADSQAASERQVAIYQSSQAASQGLKDKLISLDNPDSLAYKSVFSLSNLRASNIIGSLGHIFSSSTNSIVSMLNGHSKAAAIDGYGAASFADIETYDYPQQCYDLNPITATPLVPDPSDPASTTSTNVLAVLANPQHYGYAHGPFSISAEQYNLLNSWDVETNSELFYKTVYDIVGEDTPNVDDLVVQIYNCNLLDAGVRGSLGNIYGYTKDNGLDETSSTTSTPPPTTTPPGTCPTLNNYTPNASECKNIQYFAQSVVPSLPGTADAKATMAATVAWWALREGVWDLSNPFGYSNCGSGDGNTPIGFLDTCSASTWQVGVAAVQVPNHSDSQVISTAQTSHPGMTLQQILGQVATLAGHPQGSAEYNSAINSTGILRKSLLMRDPVTGTVLVDPDVQAGHCRQASGSADWCFGGGYSPATELATDSSVVGKVIDQLTAYFKAGVPAQ